MDSVAPPRSDGRTGKQERPETDDDLRAAIYARTSSNSQRFGYSIDEQIRRCWEYSDDAGWDVLFVFTDEAESGRNTDRPEFQSMVTRAQERLFDVVVFWKLDRFCRSLVDLVRIQEELEAVDVALHSVTEFLDTTNPVGRFNFRNLASAAELESDLTSQRAKMGMYGLAREGKWPNDSPPLGYDKTDSGTLKINDSEREVVKLIFELYIEEQSMPQVSHQLNQMGIRTKDGELWCRQSIGTVLKNKLYIGEYSLAGFESAIQEYQLLSTELFEKVTKIRHRFQSAYKPMSESRKQTIGRQVASDYRSFKTGEGE